MEQSKRVRETAESGVNMAIPYLKGGPDDINMGQGMVYWPPPAASLQEVLAQVPADVHRYGPIEGLPALREALLKKCRERNGIEGKEIHITCGGNQAFMSVVMTICDVGDEVIIFTPYYFNHLMALQLINAKAVLAPCRPDDLTPDLSVLPSLITPKTKAIVLISPNNPTGAITPPETIQKIQQLCLDKGLWLVADEAYEDFVFDGATHRSPTGPNVINIFTFSKSYGLAGWRVGYVLFPPELKEGMDKVQDTVPINACQISQRLALHALTNAGPQWVAQMVATLQRNRELAWDAVEPLRTHHERQGRTAPGVVRTQGSLYVFAKLPEGVDDMAAIKYLSHQHKVCVLPGKGFGAPGHLRVSFGNLPPELCEQAALRLKQGLQDIVDGKLSL